MNRSDLTDPIQIIPQQIDDHEILGTILYTGFQFPCATCVLVPFSSGSGSAIGRGLASTSSLDWLCLDVKVSVAVPVTLSGILIGWW
jgi:hypothetical protein